LQMKSFLNFSSASGLPSNRTSNLAMESNPINNPTNKLDQVRLLRQELGESKKLISTLISKQEEHGKEIRDMKQMIELLMAQNEIMRIENKHLHDKMNSLTTKPTSFLTSSISSSLISKKEESHSSGGDAMITNSTTISPIINIEMAATFSNSKFETTFSALKRTQVPPSQALAFYFTSYKEAQFIIEHGYISSTQQCDGVPLSLHGPDELVEDDTKWSTQVAVANKEVGPMFYFICVCATVLFSIAR
jgi:regulator of replication initiation timing